MIISLSKGGLGNMMFQIATGISLAKSMETEFAYTYDWWEGCTHHKIDHYPDTIFRNIKKANRDDVVRLANQKSIFSEFGMLYQPIPKTKDLILNGYFQTEKHFINHKDLIKKTFEVPVIEKYENYTFVHIRRGDYLKFQGVHPILTKNYYENAIKEINPSNVVVLTDDRDWAMSDEFFAQFEIPETRSDIEDLSIMKSCKSAIIANSTFGWWGAWLSDAEKVIAPATWFGNGTPIEIVPDRWIKMN